MVDLSFPVKGEAISTDHAYLLYSAVVKLVPAIHRGKVTTMIANIPGQYVGRGMLQLMPRRSRLWLRVGVEGIPEFLSLAGQTLQLGDNSIRLGVPQIRALVPAPALIARVVTIKGFTEPTHFLEAARRQLERLEIQAEIGIPLIKQGKHEGQPRRTVVRIKDHKVIGYSLQVVGLTADESIRLQEAGLGGRRHLGCGFFIPLKPRVP
jgi:CRISPR-associated protein Cas6